MPCFVFWREAQRVIALIYFITIPWRIKAHLVFSFWVFEKDWTLASTAKSSQRLKYQFFFLYCTLSWGQLFLFREKLVPTFQSSCMFWMPAQAINFLILPNQVEFFCTVLYCAVLHWTVMYFTVLYCTELYCTVLYLLYCTVLYCTEL